MRKGGIKEGNNWLVLLESIKLPDDSWLHCCGSLVCGHTISRINSNTKNIMVLGVPYCPKCEEVPK